MMITTTHMTIVMIIIDVDKVEEEVLLAQQEEQNGFGEKLNAEARVEVHFCFNYILYFYIKMKFLNVKNNMCMSIFEGG